MSAGVDERIHLPRFTAVLVKYASELPTGTYWRYRNGQLPALARWLAQRPDAAAAFAADAAELAEQQPTTAEPAVHP